MKKHRIYILFLLIFFTSCNIKDNISNSVGGNNMGKNITIFPKNENSWVGDPMPFYDGNTFNIFFLEDIRKSSDIGFHPFSLFTTNNFCSYDYKGIVIPYTNDFSSQELALGTGSIIKDKVGLYHAFYTGHNDNLSPKEAIMHATSKDMIKWTKIPSDTFLSSNQYESNDFRDPYVLYDDNSQKYWMLITTRKDSTGVIAKYTSSDLKNWVDEGVFFKNDMGTDSNLECSSLIKFKDKYYLSFSDQWPKRIVHYRIYDPISKKFKKPSTDYWDGSGFYAGRLETDGNKLYVFGWIPTKEEDSDEKNYNWAGNLAVHELIQQNNEELRAKLPDSIEKNIEYKKYNIYKLTDGVIKNTSELYFSNISNGLESVEFKNVDSYYYAEGTIVPKSENAIFGFSFNIYNNSSKLNIIFDGIKNKVEFFNTEIENRNLSSSKSEIDLEINKDQSINYKLLMENGIVVLYINNSKILSTRMYKSSNKNWGIFSLNSQIELKNINY